MSSLIHSTTLSIHCSLSNNHYPCHLFSCRSFLTPLFSLPTHSSLPPPPFNPLSLLPFCLPFSSLIPFLPLPPPSPLHLTPPLLLHSLSYPLLPLHLSILSHLSSLTLNLPTSLRLSQAIPSSFSAGVLPHLPHHRREDSSRQDAGPHAIRSVLLLTAHVSILLLPWYHQTMCACVNSCATKLHWDLNGWAVLISVPS